MPDDVVSLPSDAHPRLRGKIGSRFRDGHAAERDVGNELTKPIRADERHSAFRCVKPAPVHAHAKTVFAAVAGGGRQLDLCAFRADSDTN